MYWLNLTDNYKKTIIVDWLEIFGEIKDSIITKNKFKELDIKMHSISLTEHYHLQFQGYGNSSYENSFKVYNESKLIGMLFSIPKIKNANFKTDNVAFKISNDLLYCEDWFEIIQDFFEKAGFVYSNITRLDIAMDGANHLLKWFTNFTIGVLGEKGHYIQKSGQSSMFPKALDIDNQIFEGFQVGSRKSDRHLIIYNKTLEIKHSGKFYISDFWKKSGVELTDYMVRCEVSIRSKLLEYFDKFSKIEQLKDINFLASYYQKNTAPFLDFRYNNDINISRCTPHALINYSQLALQYLPKAEIKERDQLYKIKMGIHADFVIMAKGLANSNEITMIEDIQNKVDVYGLQTWFDEHRELWAQQYKCHRLTGHIYDLTKF